MIRIFRANPGSVPRLTAALVMRSSAKTDRRKEPSFNFSSNRFASLDQDARLDEGGTGVFPGRFGKFLVDVLGPGCIVGDRTGYHQESRNQ